MAVNNFHFKLDMEREDHIPKFRLKQYDTAIFYVGLYKNGLPYHFEGEKIKMFVKKADGTIVYQEDNITIQDDEVKINVKNQSLTASGLTYAELELRSASGQVTTATFLFEVREKVGSDKAIESITDICTLEKVDRYVGQAKKELDKFKQDLAKLEDLVANKDKLESQNTEAKVNIKGLERVLEQANNIVDNGGKKVIGNNIISESSNGYIQDIKISGRSLIDSEGIKSVGDGVEDIEIISRKENGNLFNGNILNAFISNNQIKLDKDTKSIICKVNKNTDYIFSTSNTFDRSVVMGSDKPLTINSYLKYQALNVRKIDNTILFNSGNCSYICIYFNSSNLQFNNIVVNEGTKAIPYEEPKYSIRKLLYFDKTTKSWKKPILRGINKNICDIVKKHSDNKYYFHQKCTQDPYTPGDENKDCITDKINTVKALSQENIYECLDISVRTFDPKTLVYIDSGVIESELEYYIPSSFISSDSSICEKIDILDLINFDINSIKLPGLDLNESLNKEYFNINRGMVTDFNTAKEEGKYFVYNVNGIPHAPFNGALYGLLEVNFTNDNEILQRLVTTDGKIFTRFLSSRNIWSDWIYTPTTQDFQTGTVQGKHYIKFPNGVMIQWGDLVLNFPGGSNSVKGFVYFPLSFKSDFIFTGSLARNNWTGYSETIAVLAEDSSSRGFVEARCLNNSVYPSNDKSVTINWIAIGRY